MDDGLHSYRCMNAIEAKKILLMSSVYYGLRRGATACGSAES